MEQQAVDMLRQVLRHAKKAEDFATIRAMVNEAQEHVRTQPEYWQVELPNHEAEMVFPQPWCIDISGNSADIPVSKGAIKVRVLDLDTDVPKPEIGTNDQEP